MNILKKIILPLLITMLTSAFTTYLYVKWFEGYSIDPSIEISYSQAQAVKLFLTWLIYFFTLITLPVLWMNIILWIRIKEKDWWKTIIGLELFSLVYSYLMTPPDIISTILVFLVCQPMVILNGIVIRRKLIKAYSNSLTEKNTFSNKT